RGFRFGLIFTLLAWLSSSAWWQPPATAFSTRSASVRGARAGAAHAGVKAPLATITVRSSANAGGTCPGASCTLRQAIAIAMSGDTIDFDMTTVTSPIVLASELVINKSLTIQGLGASL